MYGARYAAVSRKKIYIKIINASFASFLAHERKFSIIYGCLGCFCVKETVY